MELVTHALLGATVALAAAPPQAHRRLSWHERAALGATAAVFPDVDFVGYVVDPLAFLADWHQGPTHALPLLPLWALAIAAGFVALRRRRGAFADAAWTAAVALASHIAADAITAYGAMVAYPLSTQRIGLGWTFVVDPLFTAIVLAGLVAALRGGRRAPACFALALLGGYGALQAQWQQRALAAGVASAAAQGLAFERLSAFAQPLSPLNWLLIASDGHAHHVAHVNLAGHGPWVPRWPGLGWLHELAAAYRPPQALAWQRRERLGESPGVRELALGLWGDPRFAPFRRFATHPALVRVDTFADGDVRCLWFTDLRYDLPALPATFRYGFCRDAGGEPWQLYRLRYFSDERRQRLPRRRRREGAPGCTRNARHGCQRAPRARRPRCAADRRR